jgi:hypothetical protein
MFSPLAADNTSGHEETPTASADNAMTPLSVDEQAGDGIPPTAAVENDPPLNFSDIIHDEEHHDLAAA